MSESNYELLTHSRMACAKQCLRKYWFQYELGIVKDSESEARAIGSLVHDGLDAETVPEKPNYPEGVHDDEAREAFDVAFAKAAGLIEGYLEYWKDDACTPVEINGAPASEIIFTMPIHNPETTGQSRTFRAAGKIDKIVTLPDGRTAIMEHKTTVDNLEPESDYWKRLEMDQQISLYWLGAEALDVKIDTILYNVIRRPSIRPKKIWACDECNSFAGEKKSGATCSNDACDGGAIHQRKETPDEYRERLVDDIRERPEYYFARKEIPRLEADLNAYKAELWQQSRLFGDCRRFGYWFRNTSVCIHPFRCDYLDICADDVVDAPIGYRYKEATNEELVEDGGKA